MNNVNSTYMGVNPKIGVLRVYHIGPLVVKGL